jgi:TolB-like protein/DNA-binding winged helix-turn-helix (wHTH) protein/Tfp pilus assembly protein PilF
MRHQEERIYRFAEYTLEASEHRLKRGSHEIYLPPKNYEMLLYLVERHGHLVKKNELLDTLWADTIVTESTLTHCIEEVRKVLGDDAHHPRFIKTIPRMGYKFIAGVEEVTSAVEEEEVEEEVTAVRVRVTEEEPARENAEEQGGRGAEGQWSVETTISPAPRLPRPLAPLPSTRWRRGQKLLAVSVLLGLLIVSGLYLYNGNGQSIHSLAVLPFVNMTADPQQDYFADGITEAVIADLAKIRALRVISRTSAMQYKGMKKSLPEIARELHVDAIVEGSVLRSGERVRITAQLIHAATDRHLWGESYERDLRDILALQGEVSRAIARQIQIALTPQEQVRLTSARSINPAAYEDYLRGRYYWNKRTTEGFKRGIDYFQQAIDHEPSYALAYVGLADCYNMLNNYDVLAPKESAPKAKAAAMRAMEIDDTLAEAHASLAFTLMHYDWDWPGAEREFQRAIELNPNYAAAHHWYGLYLTAMERFDEAMVEMKHAQELDPLSLIINTNVGWVFYFRRQYDQAIEQFRKTLEMDPNFTSAHVKLGWAYEQKGMYEEAIGEFQTVLTRIGGDVLTELGHAYAVAGQRDEATKIIVELRERAKQPYVSPYLVATIYAGLGDKVQAFEWLEKSYKNRCGWLAWLKVDPKLDSLRSDQRFADLLRRVGFH